MAVKHLMTAAAIAAAVAIAPAASAQEGPPGQTDPNARAQFIGAIKSSGKTATLKARYRCAEGEALWVSAKQSKSGRKFALLAKEGSSKVASGWLQSHRNKFVCNGSYHTATFKLDAVERGSKGKLKRGIAYVQFCVTKGDDLVLSKSGWVLVR
jgi:hypothetical protein